MKTQETTQQKMRTVDRPHKMPAEDFFIQNQAGINTMIAESAGIDGTIVVKKFSVIASSRGTRIAYAALETESGDIKAGIFTLNYRPNGDASQLGFRVEMEGQQALGNNKVAAPLPVLRCLTPSEDEHVRAWRRAALENVIRHASHSHPSGGDIVFLPEGHARVGMPKCYVFLVDDPRSTMVIGLDGELHALPRQSMAKTVPVLQETMSPECVDEALDAAALDDTERLQFAFNAWKGKQTGILMDAKRVEMVAGFCRRMASQDSLNGANDSIVPQAVMDTIMSMQDPAEHDLYAVTKQCLKLISDRRNELIARISATSYGVTNDPRAIERLSDAVGEQAAPLQADYQLTHRQAGRRKAGGLQTMVA